VGINDNDGNNNGYHHQNLFTAYRAQSKYCEGICYLGTET